MGATSCTGGFNGIGSFRGRSYIGRIQRDLETVLNHGTTLEGEVKLIVRVALMHHRDGLSPREIAAQLCASSKPEQIDAATFRVRTLLARAQKLAAGGEM
jgi:hypothetical protein